MQESFIDISSRFKFQRITSNCNHYIAFPEPTQYPNNALTMTGADVAVQIHIPFAHRINKLVLCHLDAALALSTDALDIDFGCNQGSDHVKKLIDSIFAAAASAESKFTEVFGEAYEYEARTWTLTLKTTNTDLVIPVIYLQLVGKSGYT